MTEIIIYGAGGLGREIRTLILSSPMYKLIGFCDDYLAQGTVVDGATVLGGMDYLKELSAQSREPLNIVIALGSPVLKKQLVEKLASVKNVSFPSIVSPFAVLQSDSIKMGAGVIIAAGCILTTGIHLGSHVLVNINCTIGHDTVVGSYSSIMPGSNLAGNVSIGEQSLIGMGSNIINHVVLGRNVIVGAGSVVIRNVEERVTVAGVPSKIIRYGKK